MSSKSPSVTIISNVDHSDSVDVGIVAKQDVSQNPQTLHSENQAVSLSPTTTVEGQTVSEAPSGILAHAYVPEIYAILYSETGRIATGSGLLLWK